MMLQSRTDSIFIEGTSWIPVRAATTTARRLALEPVPRTTFQSTFSNEETSDGEDADTSLGEAVRDERDYVRRRLRDELGREPSEEEVDEWLRRHTEGY